MWNQLKQLAKHSMIYGLGNIAASLFSLLLVPFYTNYLNPAQFGKYTLIMILFSLFSPILDLGISNGLARFYFDETLEADPDTLLRYRQKLISTGMALSGLASIAVGLALYFLAPWLARVLLLEVEGAYYLRIIAATLPFQGLTLAPIMYLRLAERPKTYVVLSSIQIALFFSLNILFVSIFKLGVVGIFYSLLISTSIYSGALIVAALPVIKPGIDRGIAKQVLKFGLPLLVVPLLIWVVDLSDRYLVSLYTTADEVGVYSLGYKFGQVMSFVITAFSLGWVPIRFKILSLADPQVIYGRVTTIYLVGAGMIWLALSVFSRELIVTTTSEPFHQAAVFIPPVAFAYLLYGLFVLSVTGLGVSKRTASVPLIVS
jgi:O-antigen/teichoic acid export membrane protein